MRILIVDDDGFAAEMTSAVLECAGYETVMVDSGVAAVEMLASDDNFAAIVSDMNMPFISGLELFETLRAEGCRLPFILLSGDETLALHRRKPEIDGCLLKDSNLITTLPELMASVLTSRD